ncbi:MAG: hypothetical protein HQL05_14695 [Nitrospirae bacterium]|uniref:InlB B-repeat-containing protein n=1 Tax=Candidatus Magnetobacterium casense TaxID=1455061 RepID=UPI0006960DCF|nr:hypothetical protein [Candidatus Magnetobacterium casensis]MBF0339064.1 hypothetical protein [Nitrospirota bacterium]
MKRMFMAVLVCGMVIASMGGVAAAADDYVFVTKWGAEGSGDGHFYGPIGITLDSAGNVYVPEQGNHRIQKFDASGKFITKWGSQGSGDGQFIYPAYVALDNAGNVYVVEQGGHRVQKFAPSSTPTPQYILTVSKSGNGSGNVTASTGTLSWSGNTGTTSYSFGTSVTLTAIPDTGYTFANWSGDCSDTMPTCTLAMSANKMRSSTTLTVMAKGTSSGETRQQVMFTYG